MHWHLHIGYRDTQKNFVTLCPTRENRLKYNLIRLHYFKDTKIYIIEDMEIFDI